MFSAFTTFSNPFSLPRFRGGDPGSAIDISPVIVHDVETQHDKRARSLKHLLKLNHTNHSIIYHNLHFHNHAPHILGSAYILGADSEHLNEIYEKESKELESWRDSPGEISTFDWRDYLGNKEYQRAYVDFFEDQLVLHNYDWKKVLSIYLFEGKEPLINGLIAGLGHPLIHLGYAYEVASREVAMEALGMATCAYNYLHKYLDDSSYTKTPEYTSDSLVEILQKVSLDEHFNNLVEHQGLDDGESLFEKDETAMLEYWNAWHLSNPKKQLENSQFTAVALLLATRNPGSTGSYDFFLVHILTTSHAVRILLPLIPAKFHVNLVRQWWLLALSTYIGQLRPKISLDSIFEYDVHGRGWSWVDEQAVKGKWALDAHFVKGLRAIKVAAETWGDSDLFYLKAACKFADEFNGWGGFGPLAAGARRGSATGLVI